MKCRIILSLSNSLLLVSILISNKLSELIFPNKDSLLSKWQDCPFHLLRMKALEWSLTTPFILFFLQNERLNPEPQIYDVITFCYWATLPSPKSEPSFSLIYHIQTISSWHCFSIKVCNPVYSLPVLPTFHFFRDSIGFIYFIF